MPHPVPQSCTCPLGAEMPRTLRALSQAGPVTYLDGDLETLALIGTQLSEALITTNSGAALLSGMGGFSALQSTTEPFRLSQNRMTLRFDRAAHAQLVRTSGRAGSETVLALAGMDEQVAMRIETNGGYDTNVICALDVRAESLRAAEVSAGPVRDNVISLTDIRAAREGWAQFDSGHHLNAMCRQGGAARSAMLRHLGRNRATQVVTAVLPSLLTYLTQRDIAFAPLVVGGGFLTGSILSDGEASLLGSVFWIANGPQNFALDLAQIDTVWMTRCGRASHLEIYGADGSGIAVLAPDPNSDLNVWNDLLASLPECRAPLPT